MHHGYAKANVHAHAHAYAIVDAYPDIYPDANPDADIHGDAGPYRYSRPFTDPGWHTLHALSVSHLLALSVQLTLSDQHAVSHLHIHPDITAYRYANADAYTYFHPDG